MDDVLFCFLFMPAVRFVQWLDVSTDGTKINLEAILFSFKIGSQISSAIHRLCPDQQPVLQVYFSSSGFGCGQCRQADCNRRQMMNNARCVGISLSLVGQ